jgi:hypothetical protein
MKKTIIILGVAVITLSATLSFRSKPASVSIVKEQKSAAPSNRGGFVLHDQDQWK